MTLLRRWNTDNWRHNKIQRQGMPISIFNPASSSLVSEPAYQILGSDFMWFQLLIEVFLRMNRESVKLLFEGFINMCNELYIGNGRNLAIVKELSSEYIPENATWWYSRDTFVYRSLNRALRRQNINDLVLFGFLIGDLYKQLAQEQNFGEEILQLYRGQLMSVPELERLKVNKNHFISINTFLSTTFNRELALIFAGNDNKDPTNTSVLFEIETNIRLPGSKPYARISHLSAFGDTEDEVLFMLGSIFKIVNIARNEDEGVWIIKAKLSGEQENELKPVFEYMKKKLLAETDLLSLASTLQEIGKYDIAEKYYKRFLNSLPENNINIVHCYYGLGTIALMNKDYRAAYLYYDKALVIELRRPKTNQTFIAHIYENLGSILNEGGEHVEALKYYFEAEEILQTTVGRDHLSIATIHLNMGNAYASMKQYEMALYMYEQCFQTQTNLLPENHPTLASTLMNIGTVNINMKHYELALENYQKALSINLACMPNHQDTAMVYFNLGRLYIEGLKNYTEAVINFEKALKIYKNTLPTDHPYIFRARVNARIASRYLETVGDGKID